MLVRRRRIHTGGKSTLRTLRCFEGSICSLCCIQSGLCGFLRCCLHSKPVFSQCVGALFTWPQGVGHVGSPLAGTLEGGGPACTMVRVAHVRQDRGSHSVASSDLDFLLVHDPHLLELPIVKFTMGLHFFFMMGLQSSVGSLGLLELDLEAVHVFSSCCSFFLWLTRVVRSL